MSESCTDCRARRRRRETRAVETPDYAAAAVRMVKSLGKRAAEDVDALPELLAVGQAVEDALALAVAGAVKPTDEGGGGWSYEDVARRLGVSRQAVWKRYRPASTSTKPEPEPSAPLPFPDDIDGIAAWEEEQHGPGHDCPRCQA